MTTQINAGSYFLRKITILGGYLDILLKSFVSLMKYKHKVILFT